MYEKSGLSLVFRSNRELESNQFLNFVLSEVQGIQIVSRLRCARQTCICRIVDKMVCPTMSIRLRVPMFVATRILFQTADDAVFSQSKH